MANGTAVVVVTATITAIMDNLHEWEPRLATYYWHAVTSSTAVPPPSCHWLCRQLLQRCGWCWLVCYLFKMAPPQQSTGSRPLLGNGLTKVKRDVPSRYQVPGGCPPLPNKLDFGTQCQYLQLLYDGSYCADHSSPLLLTCQSQCTP
jgi:hypothetical protein